MRSRCFYELDSKLQCIASGRVEALTEMNERLRLLRQDIAAFILMLHV